MKVNGKIQPVSVFSMETAGGLASSATQASGSAAAPMSQAAAPANVFSNRLAEHSGAPSGVTVILLDTRNTKATDQIYAKAQVARYLRTLQPTDHIGIYTFGGALKVLHDYTSDSSLLLQRLWRRDKNWNLPDTSAQDATGALQSESAIIDVDLTRTAGTASERRRTLFLHDRPRARHAANIRIHRGASGAASGSQESDLGVRRSFPLDIGFDSIADWHDPMVDQRTFTEEVDRTLRAMNEANIAVYPVDARGLMTDPTLFRAESKRSLDAALTGASCRRERAANDVRKCWLSRTGGHCVLQHQRSDACDSCCC